MCDSCEVLYINGHKCHEIGCPEAWKDYNRECRACGCSFKPEHRFQRYCDDCAREDREE